MYGEEDKGVVFYETVISLKWQKHSVIECVPVPWEQFDVLPGYFKVRVFNKHHPPFLSDVFFLQESILMSEAEWSQHKKLIDFATRPGGFRRMMVPNLPYFMVQFDYKGEKGYGHVIEGSGESIGDDEGLDEGEKGGGDFPRWAILSFATIPRHTDFFQILCRGNHREHTGAGSKTMATTSTSGFRQKQREGCEIQERVRWF